MSARPTLRFEISAVDLDHSLQRASRMSRIATLQKTLANQRQQNQIVLRANTRQSQRRSRSRQQTRICLRTRLRSQQPRKVVNQPRAMRPHVQRPTKRFACFTQTSGHAQFVSESTQQSRSFELFGVAGASGVRRRFDLPPSLKSELVTSRISDEASCDSCALAVQETRIVQIVAQVAAAIVQLAFVDQRKKFAHELTVIVPTGNDDKLFSLSGDLCAIAITNASAASQRAHRLCFYSFKIVDRKLFAITEKQMEQRRERSLASQRTSIERDAIAERKYRKNQPRCRRSVATQQYRTEHAAASAATKVMTLARARYGPGETRTLAMMGFFCARSRSSCTSERTGKAIKLFCFVHFLLLHRTIDRKFK